MINHENTKSIFVNSSARELFQIGGEDAQNSIYFCNMITSMDGEGDIVLRRIRKGKFCPCRKVSKSISSRFLVLRMS